ncbi:MAG: hypothetical protein ACLQUY_05535 [Ktedonobacterales bacterium]
MAKADRSRKGIGSRLFGLINPIRDPSLLIAIVLTVLYVSGAQHASILTWLIFGVGFWIAVKAIIWLLVNFAFSFVYLIRKSGWVLRNPRLAWRLLDALGTEEIIIGGLRPDMFTAEDGSLHEGQLGAMPGLMSSYAAMQYGGALGGAAYDYAEPPYDQGFGNYQGDGNQGYDRQGPPSMRLDEQTAELRELLSTYSKLIDDWMGFTEEKWRAVSDSQLGWKPLRGRWNGWEEIYRDSFSLDPGSRYQSITDTVARRFENSQSKGSAASSVACFLHDLDALRQTLSHLTGGEESQAPRMGGIESRPQVSQRSVKTPIIRNPMIVDADR